MAHITHTDGILTVKTFYVSQLETIYNLDNLDHADEYTITVPGWYWGYVDSSASCGPFASEAEAITDAQA